MSTVSTDTFLTPSPGFEPGTKRLTVARSTAELRRIDITLISMLAMGHVFNPNILTVCNGAKRVTNSQDHSVVNTVAGELIPRLTPPPGLEPGTG